MIMVIHPPCEKALIYGPYEKAPIWRALYGTMPLHEKALYEGPYRKDPV
jgi:hypothetical protein